MLRPAAAGPLFRPLRHAVPTSATAAASIRPVAVRPSTFSTAVHGASRIYLTRATIENGERVEIRDSDETRIEPW